MNGFPRNRLSPLTLGTVQLGMPYGVLCPSVPPDGAAARQILDQAWAGGITCFDTARAYGEAEARLGGWLAGANPADADNGPLVVTKLPALDGSGDGDAPEFVAHACRESRAALGVGKLDGYLTHRTRDLHRPGVADALRGLVEDGHIGAFGVSAYAPEEVEAALSVPGLGLVQAPLGVFDQRLAASGVLARCADAGIVVFARSVFLQGLVFLDPDALPAPVAAARPALLRLRDIAGTAGVSMAALALAAVRGFEGVASTVIGVNDAEQLAENLRAAAEPVPMAAAAEARDVGDNLPADVIDPRGWR